MDQGGEEWERIRVRAEECPRISAKFLEEEREAMGERWYRQEYRCEFVDAVSGVFEREVVEVRDHDRVRAAGDCIKQRA